MSLNKYIKGEWNVICDDCNRNLKSSKVKQVEQGGYPANRRAGLVLCFHCYEPPNPQDAVGPAKRPDMRKLPFYRPGVSGGSNPD